MRFIPNVQGWNQNVVLINLLNVSPHYLSAHRYPVPQLMAVGDSIYNAHVRPVSLLQADYP